MFLRIYSLIILTLVVSVSACHRSVVSDSSSQNQPTAAPAANQSNAAAPLPSATPVAIPATTVNPLLKRASEHPGVPVAVPESMKRPLSGEELQKALQQLPPEVRQRIMGMQQGPPPPGLSKSPTPQPKKN